ncbi:hypothetical protein GcM1_238104 [Golovinomyces cichoracearum]|uniref:Uncharacterized protein n=1 Tax=Golovinomyces cichoracearum TaxID=62708 RepID=A0A420IJF6_9PEZI|nr:hypothetical protein GcM1_238104 [Golovinomyces cichoracearum]
MTEIVNGLIGAMKLVDIFNYTTLHNAAALTVSCQKKSFARYYPYTIFNRMKEFLKPHFA